MSKLGCGKGPWALAHGAGSLQGRRWLPAQVVVEMLLILPVFLGIVFTIMEMGYIAFQMIVLNHATYEVARIGAMTQCRPDGSMIHGCDRLKAVMHRILASADVACAEQDTLQDDQAKIMNKDLIVTGTNSVKLIFPISSLMLSDPRGSGRRLLTATVRMPIEQPLRY